MRFRRDSRGRWVRAEPQPTRQRGWIDQQTVRLVDRTWWRIAEFLAMLGKRKARTDSQMIERLQQYYGLGSHRRSRDADGNVVVLASAVRSSLEDRRRVDEWPELPAINKPTPPVCGVPLVSRLIWNDAETRHLLGLCHAELRDLVATGRLLGPVLFEGSPVFLAHQVVAGIEGRLGSRRHQPPTRLDIAATAPIWRRLAPGPEVDLYGRLPGEPRGVVPLESTVTAPPRPERPRQVAVPRRGTELLEAELWTVAEAEQVTGLPASTLRSLVKRGRLPAPMLRQGVQVFDAQALRRAVQDWDR